jgi:DNA-binding NarL/FixJ family response regulator
LAGTSWKPEGRAFFAKGLVTFFEGFVSDALADLVASISELEVAGVAATLRDGRRLLEELRPDILIADLFLDDGNSIDLLRTIRQQRLGTRVIVLTGVRDVFAATDALAAGALGYVLKVQPAKEIVDALHRVMAGRPYLSPRISLRQADAARAHGSQAVGLEKLSRREMEVLRLVVAGHTSNEIARRLCISPKTIDSHRSNMHRKLSLRNSVELMRFATPHGIVTAVRSAEGAGPGPMPLPAPIADEPSLRPRAE